ncbi:hypothetical protein ACFFJY_14580 [Fictibacillus aquaticus]|uniref:Uncharacterized protein n=1 Tax=Fictibacillus aquaticus TaxID=2021314 RepID=A0A235FE11_9BACL|nr:hypothetical protein [Fictibacillus aquaticus]OYD59439.1 hypothetical protein CGZ90_06000 [Fictibacillus aquaticus]
MDAYVKSSLLQWKEEMMVQKQELDEEYERLKADLQLYSYKFGITKQVIQSTSNDKIVKNIKTTYQIPFEEKFNELKQSLKDIEEKRRVYQMFVEKIEKASEMEEKV